MALLICPDCGGKVSEYAEFCPHCSCPILNIKGAAPQVARQFDRKNKGTPIIKLPPVEKDTENAYDQCDEDIKWRTRFERLNQCDYYDAFCEREYDDFSFGKLGNEGIDDSQQSGYHYIFPEFKNIEDGDVFRYFPNILDELAYDKWMISGNDFD